MRTLFFASVLAITAACSAGAQDSGGGARAELSGPRINRDFQVAGAFERVNLMGPMDIDVRVGPQASVRAEGQAAGLDRLDISVVNGELRVGTRPGTRGPLGSIIVHVTVPALAAVSLNGPGDIDIDRVQGARFAAQVNGPGDMRLGDLRVGEASFAVSGPGGIRAAGGAQHTDANVAGPGNIRLASFETRDASVSLQGPGNIDLRATGAVAVSLSGPGDVTISGSAHCTISRSGPGNVSCPNG
jgi:hypothetical protein